MNSTKIGHVNKDFNIIRLKELIIKNDAGEWGNEPRSNPIGVLRSTNFSNEGKIDDTNIALRDLPIEKQRDKTLIFSDIIIERSGGSDKQPVGRVGYIDKLLAKKSYCFANFIQRISINSEECEPKFIYYCLQQMYEMKITESMQFQTTGIRNLDYKYYINSKLPCPMKQEQQTIVSILSTVDEVIASVENTIKSAEKLKKSLMQNLLTGKLKTDGTWRKEEEFYFDEKFGKIPKNWAIKNINELANLKRKAFNPLNSKDIKDYIGLEHIEPNTFCCIGKGLSNETLSLKNEFNEGDLLFGKLRPYLNKLWLARIDGVCSTEFIVFEKNEHIIWIYLNLQSHRFLNFTTSITAGTQHPRASWNDIKNYTIILPNDIKERELIENAILSIEYQISNNNQKITCLKKLKKSLMQNLLTGKKRIDIEKIDQLLKEA